MLDSSYKLYSDFMDCIQTNKHRFDIPMLRKDPSEYTTNKELLEELISMTKQQLNVTTVDSTDDLMELYIHLTNVLKMMNDDSSIGQLVAYIYQHKETITPADLTEKITEYGITDDRIPAYIIGWSSLDDIEMIDDLVERSEQIGDMYDIFINLADTPFGNRPRDDFMTLYDLTIDTLSITHQMYSRTDVTKVLEQLHVPDGLVMMMSDGAGASTAPNVSITIGDIMSILVAICIIVSIGICTYMYFRQKQMCE